MKKPKRPVTARVSKLLNQGSPAESANWLLVQFVLVLIMDLLARTGYQMGKSPVLPLFAESLGAGPQVSGIVVAVSTTTGLLTSPLIGALSDRHGRRRLLLIGTALFAFTPFVYLFIRTPGQLILVRLVHGFATAIYGPVVSALVADMFRQRRAQHMGWYRSARTASYLLGPLLGGFVLFSADFRLAWVLVGALGLAAFLPATSLPRSGQSANDPQERSDTWRFVAQHFSQAIRNPVLLILGVIEATLYLGLRANKAFLPLYAVSVGINPAQIGILFGIQVIATLLAQPLGGYLSDRIGRRPAILGGLILVGGGLPLMVMTRDFSVLVLLSAVLGLGEAAVMPSIITLGTELSDRDNCGSILGVLDAMDNVGKALGPIVAGLLLGLFSYVTSFTIIAGILIAVAVIFCALGREGCAMGSASSQSAGKESSHSP
jgi:MFS family permease